MTTESVIITYSFSDGKSYTNISERASSFEEAEQKLKGLRVIVELRKSQEAGEEQESASKELPF